MVFNLFDLDLLLLRIGSKESILPTRLPCLVLLLDPILFSLQKVGKGEKGNREEDTWGSGEKGKRRRRQGKEGGKGESRNNWKEDNGQRRIEEKGTKAKLTFKNKSFKEEKEKKKTKSKIR